MRPSKHVLRRGEFKPNVKVEPDPFALVEAAAMDASAIAYGPVQHSLRMVKAVPIVDYHGIVPILPTVENILAGRYPLARFLYLYLNVRPGQPADPLIKEFLRFVLSRQGQSDVANLSLVPGASFMLKRWYGMNATRAHILQVAGRLFLQSNYDGVSIQAITRAVGMTKGALYHHFTSKEQLFEESDTLLNVVNSFRVAAQSRTLDLFPPALAQLGSQLNETRAGLREDQLRAARDQALPAASTSPKARPPLRPRPRP